MDLLHLIEAKRDGRSLTRDELTYFVSAFLDPNVPDYQLSALLMAMYFRGLDENEVPALAFALRDSGTVLHFPDDPRPVVDKHSTGGVGDKVTLPLTPLLACLGFRVPMVSGRGLGITGGTLDKLESVPGFQVKLSAERIVELCQTVGGVICGETGELAPADDVMYALRDVTGTVPSIPITTASILSKKLSENVEALILDCKFGAAACTPAMDDALELAQAMVDLGNACGVRTRALMTDMESPLGRAAGNWVEVKESVACLENKGPDDLRDLVVACAAHLWEQTGRGTLEQGKEAALAMLASGEPRRKFNDILAAQGSDIEALDRKLALDHTANTIVELTADCSGYITRCDAFTVGSIVRDLGAGRLKQDSALNYDVGIDDLKKPGEQVKAGDVLARIHATSEAQGEAAREQLREAFSIANTPPTPRPLIDRVIGD